jgi:hypothetical protein
LSVTPELTRFSQLPQFAPVQDFHALVTLFFNPHSAQSSFTLSEYSTPCAKIFLPPFFCHDILVCSVASCSKSALSVKSVVTNLCVLCGYSRFWLRLRCFAVFVAILASGEWSGTRGPKGSQTGSRNQNRNSICWILAKAAVAKVRGQWSVVSGQRGESKVQSAEAESGMGQSAPRAGGWLLAGAVNAFAARQRGDQAIAREAPEVPKNPKSTKTFTTDEHR